MFLISTSNQLKVLHLVIMNHNIDRTETNMYLDAANVLSIYDTNIIFVYKHDSVILQYIQYSIFYYNLTTCNT